MGMDDWRRFEARGIAVKERRGGIAGVQAPVDMRRQSAIEIGDIRSHGEGRGKLIPSSLSLLFGDRQPTSWSLQPAA